MENVLYKNVLLALTDGVYVVDLERKILFWNTAAERLTGYNAADVLGKRCADNVLCHVNSEGGELCLKGCPLTSTMQDGKLAEAAVFLHHKNGHRVPVTVKASPITDHNGNIIGAVEFFSLTVSCDSFSLELEELRQKAIRDRLTGINNRRFGEIALEKESYRSKKNNTSYGILFADIDHFKNVNDTWGHSVGDDVLRMVAKSLSSGLRSADTISRWGGEEFLVILPTINRQELAAVGERLRMLVEKSWLEYEGTTIKVTASFGGAITYKGEESKSVLQRADSQLYYSKNNGRNLVSIDSVCNRSA